MEKKKPLWRYVAGVILIIAGVFGLFLPLAPGVVFIVGGLYILDRPYFKRKIKEWRHMYRQWRRRFKK